MNKLGRIVVGAFLALAIVIYPACVTTSEPHTFTLSTNQKVCITGGTATILYDEVGGPEDAFQLETLIKSRGIHHLDIYLNNGGGNIFSMMDYIDMLKRVKAAGVTVTTYARGVVASAAVPIFLMGDRRVIAPHAWIMLHPGSWRGERARRYGEAIPDAIQRVLDKFEMDYASIIGERTKMSRDRALMILRGEDTERDQYWMNAEDAITFGFATEIG